MRKILTILMLILVVGTGIGCIGNDSDSDMDGLEPTLSEHVELDNSFYVRSDTWIIEQTSKDLIHVEHITEE